MTPTNADALPDSYASQRYSTIRLSHHPDSSPSVTPVVVVSLHRPAALNGFTDEMADELAAAFAALSADPRVRAVVLASSDPRNKTFCVGMDFNERYPMPDRAEDHRDSGGRLALAIYNCVKPVVVAINGSAVGIGMTMTLPADVRVASRDAKVGFVFARRGFIMEACSSFFLPRLIGTSRALHLLSTGAVYPASHKLFGELFSEVVAPDEVLPTALAIADDIAANVSTKAARIMKDLIYRGADSPEGAHLLESRVFHGMALGEDAKEGKESFLQKRKPDFKATMADAPSTYPWWSPVDVRVKPKI
ncbi:hypothetical protein JDV02_009238 [Purpureocillium takamizusanense]|uniref:Enoyl-CoA hydratase n=1 Tax=Purpureocillium takamizusanense TaxID=2060973 RepID=A0A9Q8VFZ4_9HYPO|nr:uncharacterized protein JDV02_009238 [Purpureocillium takamizusanense]UNI23419.1 hypothetical protein JDV02_009238 [Purpureocillium takamizusanense]